eukprot:768744-Hanusia_phi.AAC.8
MALKVAAACSCLLRLTCDRRSERSWRFHPWRTNGTGRGHDAFSEEMSLLLTAGGRFPTAHARLLQASCHQSRRGKMKSTDGARDEEDVGRDGDEDGLDHGSKRLRPSNASSRG